MIFYDSQNSRKGIFFIKTYFVMKRIITKRTFGIFYYIDISLNLIVGKKCENFCFWNIHRENRKICHILYLFLEIVKKYLKNTKKRI